MYQRMRLKGTSWDRPRPLWSHRSTEYPSKRPSMTPNTGPSIWTAHHLSSKPSNTQSFNPSEILTYVNPGYFSIYITVVSLTVPII